MIDSRKYTQTWKVFLDRLFLDITTEQVYHSAHTEKIYIALIPR